MRDALIFLLPKVHLPVDDGKHTFVRRLPLFKLLDSSTKLTFLPDPLLQALGQLTILEL